MIVIFRGPSGSGKSTLAKLLASIDYKFGDDPWKSDAFRVDPASRPAIDYCRSLWTSINKTEHRLYSVSADDYFMVEGKYKFDAKHLGAAHAACLRNYNEVVRDLDAVIIVDNTNCSIPEFVPYAALANAYGHEIHIVTLVIDPIVAWTRNKHNTPFASIVKQSYNLQKSIIEMPPWFPQQIFPITPE